MSRFHLSGGGIFLTLACPALLLPAACGDDISARLAENIQPVCNPLGAQACLMPWPSAAYLTPASTATGLRLDLPIEAMPRNTAGAVVDPAPFNRLDGFSPTGPILAVFPTGVSAAGLPGHRDPAASLQADAATVLLDMATGERVLHFAEVDANAGYPDERALIIRPLERLAPATRYAVAILEAVKAEDGSDLPVSPLFAALVAGDDSAVARSPHPRVARLASRYDDIFAALDKAGVAKSDLVLAWDFVTASDDSLTGDLLAMRSQALASFDSPLTFTASETPGDPSTTFRALVGTFQAPSFLSDGEEDDSVLVRDDSDRPAQNGLHDASFAAVLPACVNDPDVTLPIPVILFGHGLFGSALEYARDDLLPRIANQFCVAVIAGDFIGLTSRQIEVAALATNDLDTAGKVTEKLAQSVIDFITLGHMARGTFAADDRFRVAGQAILDPTRVYYLGASLGGIMGGVIMAYDPFIERGVLGVPGGAWSLLLERSLAWATLKLVASLSYRDDPSSYQILVALFAMRFEPYDPITTARRVIADPLPDTPAKQLLLYEALGDSLVTNLSTEMLARTLAVPVLEPSVRLPYGLAGQTGPLASGLAIYDEHRMPLPPDDNTPPGKDNGTHGGVNRRSAVLEQVAGFLLTGQIVSHCVDGAGAAVPCDCATGACDAPAPPSPIAP